MYSFSSALNYAEGVYMLVIFYVLFYVFILLDLLDLLVYKLKVFKDWWLSLAEVWQIVKFYNLN
jgi:hypothetical protein